jgi:hypothetical protein
MKTFFFDKTFSVGLVPEIPQATGLALLWSIKFTISILSRLRSLGIMMMLSPMQGFGGHHQQHQRQLMQMQNVPPFTPSFAPLFPPARDR